MHLHADAIEFVQLNKTTKNDKSFIQIVCESSWKLFQTIYNTAI